MNDPLMATPSAKISELASLIASKKLVPFLGAGCSVRQLGYDWKGITDAMKAACGSTNTDYLEIAQDYVDQHGKSGLRDFIQPKLTLAHFDDAKGAAHIAAMLLGTGIVYTTNQDDVFEKCCEKYGRAWRVVVDVDDLAAASVGDRLYIKFHGDLRFADSIVYTTDDFEFRKRGEHALDIRLRSDLLGRQLLFLGYGLQDPNMWQTLDEINRVFRGTPPKSYLVAYSWHQGLQDVCDRYGVEIIRPSQETGLTDADQAFDVFLRQLLFSAYQMHQKQSFEAFFDDSGSLRATVTEFEVQALEARIAAMPVANGLSLFTEILCHGHFIPRDFHGRVAQLFIDLAHRCATDRESRDFAVTAGALQIDEIQPMFDILGALMTTANTRYIDGPTYDFGVHLAGSGYSEELALIPIARAIQLLESRSSTPNEVFKMHVRSWMSWSMRLDQFPDSWQRYVEAMIGKVWAANGSDNPLAALKRNGGRPRLSDNGMRLLDRLSQEPCPFPQT